MLPARLLSRRWTAFNSKAPSGSVPPWSADWRRWPMREGALSPGAVAAAGASRVISTGGRGRGPGRRGARLGAAGGDEHVDPKATGARSEAALAAGSAPMLLGPIATADEVHARLALWIANITSHNLTTLELFDIVRDVSAFAPLAVARFRGVDPDIDDWIKSSLRDMQNYPNRSRDLNMVARATATAATADRQTRKLALRLVLILRRFHDQLRARATLRAVRRYVEKARGHTIADHVWETLEERFIYAVSLERKREQGWEAFSVLIDAVRRDQVRRKRMTLGEWSRLLFDVNEWMLDVLMYE
mmetsp:Transcript_93766/g.270172  ORF Transcript_93766/g.270172 Transcript_93766/m.270172 type:complete len:303 (-) Transcript_93766:112-1020(-)